MKKLLILLPLLALVALPVSANHSWGGYHWARTSNPFTLKLGDNLSSAWDSYLNTTSSDWSASAVLDTTIVPGAALRHRSSNKDCTPGTGVVEVCNKTYGNNGWLGLAQIWISGGHITKGATKVNDTYFNNSKYNTAAWRNLVMCQEVGHTLGLDHQDENFSNPNLGTCMDYTNDPTSNQHPNQHDYDQLALIYSHLDSFTTIKQSVANLNASIIGALNSLNSDEHADWGQELRKSSDGRGSLYVRDLGRGEKVFTFVIWAN